MNSVPKRLYKYVGPDRVDIIESEQLRYTPPMEFNDVFDVQPVIRTFSDPLFFKQVSRSGSRDFWKRLPRRLRPDPAKRKEIKKQVKSFTRQNSQVLETYIEKTLHRQISDTFGVLCMSESPDVDLMWAHHADSHKGFVIEFDMSHPSIVALGEFQKVDYVQDVPIYTPSRPDGFWLKKTMNWSYEVEWRATAPLTWCKQAQTKDGRTLYFRPFSKEAISGIYLGSRLGLTVEKRISTALSGTSATVYQRIRRPNGQLEFDKR